jgi:hypothetical protein
MSADSDARRLVDRLEQAGWQGAEESREYDPASMRYSNGRFFLEVQAEPGEHELVVELSDRHAHGVTLYVVYDDSLDAFLDALVVSQDEIDAENFRDHVRTWLRVCPRIYTQQDEDSEPQLLTLDEDPEPDGTDGT